MTGSYDAIVLGLGGMGSAAAYQLARRGRRVLGLEQFGPAHDRGSSHGRSRIIRQAYFEGPGYVPLLLRAYELWRELERESGRELLRITGGLMIGREGSEVVTGAIASARKHHLPHRILASADLRRCYPLTPADGEIALYEEVAGALFPEDCIRAHLDRAAALGADLHFDAAASGWRTTAAGVEVTVAGETLTADHLVVTAGSWAAHLLAGLGLPLQVERQVLYWFAPGRRVADFDWQRFPLFIWDDPVLPFYGLPDLHGEGVKVGFHHGGETADPDHLRREVAEVEVAGIRTRLREKMPDLDGALKQTAVCMYTNTPDEHFAIGLHPAHPQVSLAAGFSGHGFKFAAVVGEVLADLACTGTTAHPIEQFRPDRFS